MRLFTALLIFFLPTPWSFAQTTDESRVQWAPQILDSLEQSVLTKADSSIQLVQSIETGNILSDTVKHFENKLDSIQSTVNNKLDSITHAYTGVLGKIQGSAHAYQKKLDSLKSINLPTEKLEAKMDSLSNLFSKVQTDLNTKLTSIKSKATEGISALDLPPELDEKVSQLTSTINSIGPQTIESRLPASLSVDKLSLLSKPLSVGNLANIPNPNIPGAKQIPSLGKQQLIPDVQNSIGDIQGVDKLSDVTSEAGALQSQVSETTNDLNPGSIDELADSKISQLEETKALREQSIDLPLDPSASEEEMKAKLKAEAQKIAVDHFAEKQEQLQAAMERISKYKAKYSSISSIADIAKKPPNPMREKSFLERLVPGVGFQIQSKGEDFLLDVNTYVGYRFTKRITAGPGWNQRLPYNFDVYRFHPDARIFGPRVFGEYTLGKGFSPRLEVELMNTEVPPQLQSAATDPDGREWVWGVFAGIKKTYKITKHIKGTASVMTRLFNPDRKSPYADVLNVRFGLEYVVKKKGQRVKQKKSR
jgi:hypothetical protein